MVGNNSVFIVWTFRSDAVVSCCYSSTLALAKLILKSVLMQWAEGGSLDGFIRARLGVASGHSASGPEDNEELQSRSDRIRAFRSAQARPDRGRAQHREKQKAERGRAVHLLSAEEVKSIFSDVVNGLGFLVSIRTLSRAVADCSLNQACKGHIASRLEAG